MKEVLRTSDVVRLSWLRALLAESRIETIVLDSHTSVLEGSANAIPRRLMVIDEDFDHAIRVLRESGELGTSASAETGDALLNGRLRFRQPKSGYRAAIDPILLAAAVPPAAAVLDVGCGSGAATVCYAYRVRDARVTGLELRADWADLAEENARANQLGDRVTVVRGDLLQPPRALTPGTFDQVMANPPYLPSDRADMRNPPDDADATVEGDAGLSDWIDFCLSMAKPDGSITLIHRADRLDEILSHILGRAGGIVVFPLWPRRSEADAAPDARRVIVAARKGTSAPMRLAAGMVLHDAQGYTDEAEAVIRDGGALTL